ncbi:MAG TPA: aldo/keto reductase [Pyrinomonadaceae bacterium]|nr:aldo/keto reductase [Pyrinomonadaceae bacterium]
MKYARLGNTGLIVSRLSFGAMTLGNDPSMPTIFKVDLDNAKQMVEHALAAGINFLDTADMYSAGQSERMLGEILGKRRPDIVLATKVGFRSGEPVTQAGLSRRHILFSCEQSLKRLNTDYIDLYILHREDIYTPLEETLETMNELVRSGKVRYIGFSNWSAWRAATAVQMQIANGWAQFCNGQYYYSMIGRDVEQDIVPFMRYAGLGMTAWSPLAGGFLSGKYTRENLSDANNRLSGPEFLPLDKEAGFKLVDRLREMAQSHDTSVAQIALAWLLAKPVVSSILVGASKVHQLEDNLKAVEVNLTEAEVAELDAMTKPQLLYPHWFNQNLADAKHKEALGSGRS